MAFRFLTSLVDAVDTLVAFRIDGWSYSVRKQLRHSPKYYFFDCGVLNAVRGELQTELKSGSYRYGKLFETFFERTQGLCF